MFHVVKPNQEGILSKIEPFKDECGKWWFRLFYEYEDEEGYHRVVYPKVEAPFYQAIVPYVNTNADRDSIYIRTKDTANLERSTFYDAHIRMTISKPIEKCYCCDVVIRPKKRKMTLWEIEKELGYPIELTNETEDY